MAGLKESRRNAGHRGKLFPRRPATQQAVVRHRLGIAAAALETALAGLADLRHALSVIAVPPHT
jgi:alkylation response protein AidB-like acyl-CoA dehydrogenase